VTSGSKYCHLQITQILSEEKAFRPQQFSDQECTLGKKIFGKKSEAINRKTAVNKQTDRTTNILVTL